MESECGQEVQTHASGVFTGIKKARKACKALRTCKKGCRKSKRSERKTVKKSKKACKQECKGLKKKKKRLCVKQCRTTAKGTKRQNKGSKKSCMTTCRKQFKTSVCTSARGDILKSLLKAATSLAGNEVCQGYVKEAHDALKKTDKAEGPGTAKAAPNQKRKPGKPRK